MHFGEQFVALAGALAHSGEDRDALVFFHCGVDQLHHQHGFAHPCPAEHRRLAALGERGEEIDHLDAGFEDRGAGTGRRQIGRGRMDRAHRGFGGEIAQPVARLARHIEQPAQHRIPHRDAKRGAGAAHTGAARKARGRVERDGADGVGVLMAVDFKQQGASACGILDHQRGVDRRQGARIVMHIDHRAAHGDDRADAFGRV